MHPANVAERDFHSTVSIKVTAVHYSARRGASDVQVAINLTKYC